MKYLSMDVDKLSFNKLNCLCTKMFYKKVLFYIHDISEKGLLNNRSKTHVILIRLKVECGKEYNKKTWYDWQWDNCRLPFGLQQKAKPISHSKVLKNSIWQILLTENNFDIKLHPIAIAYFQNSHYSIRVNIHVYFDGGVVQPNPF